MNTKITYDGQTQENVSELTCGGKTFGISAEANLQTKTASSNGEITPDAGYDGLEKVIVSVESSGAGGIVKKTVHGSVSSVNPLVFTFDDIPGTIKQIYAKQVDFPYSTPSSWTSSACMFTDDIVTLYKCSSTASGVLQQSTYLPTAMTYKKEGNVITIDRFTGQNWCAGEWVCEVITEI